MPYVTDTHALIWHLTNNPKLSAQARQVFQGADAGRDHIIIPCIILFEIAYLSEKRKIAIDFQSFLGILREARNYKIEPLCLPIIEKSHEIPRDRVKDPWDRLIAATALYRGLPLISYDRSLQSLHLEGLKVIW